MNQPYTQIFHLQVEKVLGKSISVQEHLSQITDLLCKLYMKSHSWLYHVKKPIKSPIITY